VRVGASLGILAGLIQAIVDVADLYRTERQQHQQQKQPQTGPAQAGRPERG
jgi:hypothetical protein